MPSIVPPFEIKSSCLADPHPFWPQTFEIIAMAILHILGDFDQAPENNQLLRFQRRKRYINSRESYLFNYSSIVSNNSMTACPRAVSPVSCLFPFMSRLFCCYFSKGETTTTTQIKFLLVTSHCSRLRLASSYRVRGSPFCIQCAI